MDIIRNSIAIDVSLLKDELFLEESQCKYGLGLCQYVGCMDVMVFVSVHDIL